MTTGLPSTSNFIGRESSGLDDRYVSIVHRRCAVQSAEGAADRRDYRFGVANRGETGLPRRRAFLLTEIVPRLHLKYDRATNRGAH